MISIREKESLTLQEAADHFRVSVASVMRWVKDLVPRTTRNKPALKINMEALARDVEEHPDSYYYERAARFSVSSTCTRKALKRLGVTYKKSLQHPKAQSEARTAFQGTLKEYQDEGRSVVFINENGFAHDMPRKVMRNAAKDVLGGLPGKNADALT